MTEQEKKGIEILLKAQYDLDKFFRELDGKAFRPGCYYKGPDNIVIKVVKKSSSGKTVYLTTNSDDDNSQTIAKRVKVDMDGNEYIATKKGGCILGCWQNTTNREDFISYIQSNMEHPVAIF